MTQRFVVVPAAYVVFLRDDQILLQMRQGTGYMDGCWATAAAGHVEADESVFEAATREAHEELGVQIEESDLEPLCGMHRTGGKHLAIDERVDWFFACRRWSGDPMLVEPDKAVDLRWFPMDGLPAPVVPHEKYVFDHLRAGTLAPVVAFGFVPVLS